MKDSIYRLFFILLFLAGSSYAQKHDYKSHFNNGNNYLLEENYAMALEEYMKSYAIDSTNANINFKIGYCYLYHPTQKHLAETYLAKAIKDVSGSYNEDNPMFKAAPPYAYFYYGQALHLDYKFDAATGMYNAYEKMLNEKRSAEDIELIEHYKLMAENAKKRTADPAKIHVSNLGDSVNSVYPDFSPLLSADERMLIFTYRGIKSTGADLGLKTEDGRYFEDIFVCYKKDDGKWTSPVSISQNINTIGHEGSVGLTADGQTLIIYRDDKGDGNLYHSTWTGTDWTIPEKYGPEINSKYWEPSACLAPDGNTLYFVSDRPDGYGGRDIYRCKKLPNGNWALPMNLGPKINTPYDEESPFMHPNGTDLYFSSQGHGSMGGFDIMFSKMDQNGTFSDPAPLDYPINTTDDDVFFVVSPDSKRGYYSSSHEDREGFGEKDIYMLLLEEPTGADILALLKGQIISSKGLPLPGGVEIFITDKTSGELVGIYRPQARTGAFVSILKPGLNYVISYQLDGKEFHNEDLSVRNEDAYQEIHREIILDPVKLNLGGGNEEETILLDVLALNAKDKNPVANAKIEVYEKGKTGTSVSSDANGKAEAIQLKSGNTYELYASMGQLRSETVTLSTNGMKAGKISKTVYLGEVPAVATKNSKYQFRHFFTYNQNKIENNEEYIRFLSDVETQVKEKGKADIAIHSCASKVPTTQYGGSNNKLAQLRAESMKKDVIAYLQSKGLSEKAVKFELSSTVEGPEYHGDFLINKKNFEKFQYVEAGVK
ncbi:MAG: hypothetical protein ACJ76F_13505 [Bacteroidia bacterium]